MSPIPTLVLGCLGGIVTLTLGAWSLGREVEPDTLGVTSLERVVNMADVSTLPGLSLVSQQRALLDCVVSVKQLQTEAALNLPDADRASIVPKCVAMTDYVLLGSPVNSYAWFVRALIAKTDQDWSGMNSALALSQRTGPTELWVGEQRIALADDNIVQLDALTMKTNDADLLMLMLNPYGLRSLAARYVEVESFRDRVTPIVENLPAEYQQAFLTEVRRAARQIASLGL